MSPVHRAPAGLKLLALAAVATCVVAFRSPGWVLAGAVVVAGGYAIAGVGARLLAAQVWPLRWVVLVLVPAQVWLAGWRGAFVVVGGLLVAVCAAGLVTATTRTSELLDALVRILRPMRRLGVDADRVALVLALTVRAVPVVSQLVTEVREARRARGLEHSLRAFVTPVAVRALRHADRLGEALAARGVDD